MTIQIQKKRDTKRALQEAKDRCKWYIDTGTLGAKIALEDRFDRLARDLGLGKLK